MQPFESNVFLSAGDNESERTFKPLTFAHTARSQPLGDHIRVTLEDPNVSHVTYYPFLGLFCLAYKSGKVAQHPQVPQEVFDNFKESRSKASFYRTDIWRQYRLRMTDSESLLTNFSTKELSEELYQRDGITTIRIGLAKTAVLQSDTDNDETVEYVDGQCVIVINRNQA